MMSTAGRNHAPLGNWKRVARVFKRNALDPNVADASRTGSEHLFLDCQFDLMLGRVCIEGKPDMDGQAIVLAPKSAVFLSEFLVKLYLLQFLSIDEYHPTAQQMHPQFFRFRKQVHAVLHNVDGSERVVALKVQIVQAT